jgi:hypothetical protein
MTCTASAAWPVSFLVSPLPAVLVVPLVLLLAAGTGVALGALVVLVLLLVSLVPLVVVVVVVLVLLLASLVPLLAAGAAGVAAAVQALTSSAPISISGKNKYVVLMRYCLLCLYYSSHR